MIFKDIVKKKYLFLFLENIIKQKRLFIQCAIQYDFIELKYIFLGQRNEIFRLPAHRLHFWYLVPN